jgi:predicted GNAT family acetyltransferase
VDIVDNEPAHRYEAYLDGALAGFISYRDEPRGRVFVHTEVDPDFEGKGVGATLVPVCPFVSAYLKRHPEFQDVVAKS